LWGLCRVDKHFVTIGICSRHIRNTLTLYTGFLAYIFTIPFSVYFLPFSLSIPSPFPCVDLPRICATLLFLALLFYVPSLRLHLLVFWGFAFFLSPLGGVDFFSGFGWLWMTMVFHFHTLSFPFLSFPSLAFYDKN